MVILNSKNSFGVNMDQNVWLLLAIALGGVLLVFAIFRIINSKNQIDRNGDVYHKDGLPITPRDKRLINQTDVVALPSEDTPDALTSMAAVAASSPVVNTADRASQSATVKVVVENTDDAVNSSEYMHEETEKLRELNGVFDQNSPILDKHLSDQESFDQNNSPLLNATDNIAVVITPRDVYAGISGKTVLNLVREHGLKYGVMNMFHRYEHENGTGDLWFSMMGVNNEGVQPFDLNVLSDSRFDGVLLFLSLPHPHALRGFDSMVSVAQMIADDLEADIYNESGYILDEADFAKLRAHAANYQ